MRTLKLWISGSFQWGGMRGEVTCDGSWMCWVVLRVGITGAEVVVAFTTATLVEMVGIVVVVVVLDKAGRRPTVVVTKNEPAKRQCLIREQSSVRQSTLTLVVLFILAAHFEDDFHVVRRTASADAPV